ncbi:Gluconolactonase precursor [Planctomycetes bacterium K23_9]|uniref:Gluconolactonase n=2 Tax=Stieleria marina TaxID=1930275 RepID=A0A517P0K4_9BACT|nr:Gluconolactonase precursor [Planctomycetes bacterium K23_9]
MLAAEAARAQWETSQRYPDPRIKIDDQAFEKYRLANAKVQRIATGMRWADGPVWFADGRYLLWSDIPSNCIMKWDATTKSVSVFRKPAGYANGHCRDRQGRLLTCEHEPRRVTRTEYDGSTTVVASHYQDRPLNSPNDVVCKSDGSIWFTDPTDGILGFYEGKKAKQELPTNIYRWDAETETLAVVATDIKNPNGLAFSPDESKLYVVEAGVMPRVVREYEVVDKGKRLGNVSWLVKRHGTPEGLKVDVDGNLWIGWGAGEEELDGVWVFNPNGQRIGRIQLPERCANVCFGGRHRNRLFMCASTSIYSLHVNTQGCKLV